MERLQKLLDSLEINEESDEEEVSQDYASYKLAAMQCEKRFSEQRKLQHKMLLSKIEEIDYKLKQRSSAEKIEVVGSSLSGTMANSEKRFASFSSSPRKVEFNCEGSLDKNFNYVCDAEDLDKSKELLEAFTKLSDLKNQEQVLEEWYSTMTDQLQQEQMKLKDNFNDMKLKILQQKQHYLKASQEYISSISNGSMEESSVMVRGRVFDDNALVGIKEIGTFDGDEKNPLSAQMKEPTVSDQQNFKKLCGTPRAGSDFIKSDYVSTINFEDFDERIHGMSDFYPSDAVSVGACIESDLDVGCQSIGEEKSKENSNNAIVPHTGVYERLGAVARGYLTRKLMATDKVLELIKTIKDTRAVLADMNNEDKKIHKKLHETKADELLKATVYQEMQNALNKFYAIFLAYTPKEKMELIARSRTAAVDRRMKLYDKGKRSTLEQEKRLSTVTRKKLKKKQESLLKDYCIARPQSSPPFTGDHSTRKQRKSWDIRAVQPVPSNGSPFHYARNRDRKVSQQVNEVAASEVSTASQNEAPRVPVAKKGPKRKIIAATLNRKNEASNG